MGVGLGVDVTVGVEVAGRVGLLVAVGMDVGLTGRASTIGWARVFVAEGSAGPVGSSVTVSSSTVLESSRESEGAAHPTREMAHNSKQVAAEMIVAGMRLCVNVPAPPEKA